MRDGVAHAALVIDGDEAVAWCEYGTPDELPNIHHRKQYEATLDIAPDFRITCIFVDRRYRRQGVTAVALGGALDLIARAGGGVVEGYPHDTGGPEDVGVVRLQRHANALRGGRLQLRPAEGSEQLRDAPDRRACRRCVTARSSEHGDDAGERELAKRDRDHDHPRQPLELVLAQARVGHAEPDHHERQRAGLGQRPDPAKII